MEGRLLRLLRALEDHGIAFILVGGLSGVLHGAPIHTHDVDIVHRRDPENVARLVALLTELDATYRMQPERRLRPTASHLESTGHHNLATSLGWLDVLGAIGHGEGYDELAPRSHVIEIASGLSVRVLDLAAYIAMKEELGSPKDQAVLPLLRATLRERKRNGQS